MNQEKYWEKEWLRVQKQEEKFLEHGKSKTNSPVTAAIEEKIPEKVAVSLKVGFGKAVSLILEKGTDVIEKTYDKDDLQKEYQINQFAYELKQDGKSARAFRNAAKTSSHKNMAISGVKGVGFGLMGVGIPDIPVFVSMIFRSIYEISLSYGYDYESEEEKQFILQILRTSLTAGEDLLQENKEVNDFILGKRAAVDRQQEVAVLSDRLAQEVLCSKFVQGIPVVGVMGGVADVLFMERILKYVKLKYDRRFVLEQKKKWKKAEAESWGDDELSVK